MDIFVSFPISNESFQHFIIGYDSCFDTWVVSTFWLLRIMLLGYLLEFWLSLHSGIYPEVELLDCMVIVYLIFSGATIPISTVAALFYILHPYQQSTGVQISPHPHQQLLISFFLSFFLIIVIQMGMSYCFLHTVADLFKLH